MSIQMDEIWSYLQKKKRQLWLFITLEAQTKFWVNFELGSRTAHTAHPILRNIVCLMPWGFEHFLLVTTDKLAAYEKAAREADRARDRELLPESSLCLSSLLLSNVAKEDW